MKIIIRIAILTALILLIPLMATYFSDEFNWSFADFVVMGTMIFIASLGTYLATRKIKKCWVFVILLIVILFLWLWAELAVGVFTNWGS